METATDKRDRIRREAHEMAFGPQLVSTRPAPAPAAPKKGVLAKLKDVAAPAASATVETAKAGFQNIGHAFSEGDEGYLSRAGEALLGALKVAMAAGPAAGGAIARQGAEQVWDKNAKLPPELNHVFRTAEFLFSLPEHMLNPKERAAERADPEGYRRELANRFNEPATAGDVAEFLGQFAGAKAGAKVVEGAAGKALGEPRAKAPAVETPQAARAKAAETAKAKLAARPEPEAVTGPREPEAVVEPDMERMAPPSREPEGFTESGNSPPGPEPGVGIATAAPMADHDIAMAKEYDEAPISDPAAKEAWDRLAADTDKKYDEIAKKVQIEKVTGQPYASAAEMNADIANGRFKVTTDNSEHPFWDEDQNWKFRVVHDYLGHFEPDNDFSLAGETKAYHAHAKQVEDALAKKALQLEIYGQAAANVAHNGEFQPQKAYITQQPEPPVPPSRLKRLYRLQDEEGKGPYQQDIYGGAAGRAPGRFFSARPATIDAFTKDLPNGKRVYVDVPEETAKSYATNGTHVDEYLVPEEVAGNAQELTDETPEPAIYNQNALPPDEANPSAAETMVTPTGEAADADTLEQVRRNEQMLTEAGRAPEQPVGEAPGAEPVGGEPTEEPVEAPAEGAEGAPQVQTFDDAAQAVAPAITQNFPKTAGDYVRIREQSAELAKQLRAEGKSRQEVNDGVRQFLNDNGILSQNQIAAAKLARDTANAPENQPLPTPSSEDLSPEHVNNAGVKAELAKLKQDYARLHDSVNKLLGIDESTAGGGVPLRGDITQLGETGKAAAVVLNQMAHVGAAIILQGAKTFKAWAAAMRKEFGDISDEVLKKLFPKAQASLKTLQDQFPQMLTPKGAQQAFTRGKSGMLWYDKAPEELAKRYGPENVQMAADAYAATSIDTRADTVNIDLADKAIKMILRGERDGFDKPFTVADGVSAGSAQQVMLEKLNEIARGGRVTGAKIGPYADTLAGNATGVDAQGNRVFKPVLDSWIGRGFKFIGPDERWSPTEQQRAYITKVISDIANAEGVEPHNVQAAMWVEFKRAVERDRVKSKAMIPRDEDFAFGNLSGNTFRPGWDRERLQAAYDKINNSAETPFDELLQNRLGPAIQAAVATGDTSPEAGSRLLGAKVMKALAEPGALEDPSATAVTALQSAGLTQDTASGLVPKIWQAVKDRLNSTDPEGAALSQASMGINPFDVFRLFHKDPDLASMPFDAEAASEGIAKVKDLVPDADEALRADLRKPVTPEISKSIKDASTAALTALRATMAKDVWEPGELHHAVTITAALAEKARNAEIREKSLGGRRGPVAVKPINDDALTHFAESVHEMSEPELYSKLTGLDADSQGRWLANMFRASNAPSHFSMEGLENLYHGLYYNEALSSARTLAKSIAVHTSVFPWILAQEGIATQIGRFTENAKRAVPGQMGQLWAGLSEGLMQHWKGVAAGDIEGLKLVMEQEGDLHLMGSSNPQTMLDNILNIGSAPSAALGSVRSPIKNALRRGALFAESFRRVTEEARADESLLDQSKFQQRLEELRREPDEDLLKYANDYADKWSLTKKYNDLRGTVQANGKLDTTGMLLLDPFASVGVNAMSLAAEMNPITSLLSPEFRSAMREPGAARDRALASLALGSAVLITGMAMQQQGWIDGPGPTDTHAHAMWEAAGHSSNTVRNPLTGKPAFETKYLGIFGPLLTSGAAMAQVWDGLSEHTRQQSVFALAHAIGQTVTAAGILDTYSKIVTAVASGVNDNGAALMNYLRDKLEAGLLVFPGHVGLLRDLNGFLSDGTPMKESKYDNKDLVSQQWDLIEQEFTAGLPGWEQGQPQIRDPINGKIVPRLGLMGARDIDPSKVAAEIDRLQSAQQGLKFDIVKPKRSVGGSMTSRTGPGSDPSAYDPIPLSPWQYDRKIQIGAETTLGGKTLDERLSEMIDSARYQQHAELENKSPSARREGWCAARLREIYHDYETRAEQLLLKEDRHLSWEVAKSQYDAQQLQSTNPRPFPQPEPEPTKYPLPGQNTRK